MASYEKGDFIKVEFVDEGTGESEWMWVKVDRRDDPKRIVYGHLENQPVAVFRDKLRLGQEIAVSYDPVRDHAKS